MLADVIHDRIASPEFQPFTLVLVNGERITVQHRDSLAHPSTIVNGRKLYSSHVVVVLADGDTVVTRSISLPMIAQVIDEHRLNGAA